MNIVVTKLESKEVRIPVTKENLIGVIISGSYGTSHTLYFGHETADNIPAYDSLNKTITLTEAVQQLKDVIG